MRVCYFACYRNIGYYDQESYSDIKDTNGNVVQADVYCFEDIGMNAGYTPPNPFVETEQQSIQFFYDMGNGIITIDTAYDVQEVRVFHNGNEKRFQLVADETQADVANYFLCPTEELVTRKRNKRRTPSTFEKNFYRKYGERFHEGSASCRNDILNEIMEYQRSHPTEDWIITDRIGIYNYLYNNYDRARKNKS